MKLYDFLQVTHRDYDCYDTEQDVCVTVCYIDEINDNYDGFCVELAKKVDLVEQTGDSILICDWTKLIKDNYDCFKAFTIAYWNYDYDDETEFIYQWIRELHLYAAGEVSDGFCRKLRRLVRTLS